MNKKMTDNKKKKQSGFTLIEIVAVAALIGVLITMLAPSLDGANNKVKNARLKNDLTVVDQAIALYKMENGKYPADLKVLQNENYFADKNDLKDAVGEALTYTPDTGGLSYTLTGKNAEGEAVQSNGSKKTDV